MIKLDNNINTTLSEQISNKILNYINENKLNENDKLPNELELTKMLGVSRTTVREAIKILISKNILYIKRGSGTYVANKEAIDKDPLGLQFLYTDKLKLIYDLLEIRFLIEPSLAFSAANNATQEEILELEKQCKKVEDLILNDDNHMEEDINFHKIIAKCTKNKVVENLIPIINSSIYSLCDITNRNLKNETIDLHREIVDSIKKRDANGARYAMQTHLYYNRKSIIELIEKNN